MVRKQEAVSIGDAITEFLNQYKHKGKIDESQAINAWYKIMGTSVANLTLSVYMKGGKMFIQLKSSALRNELMMHRSKIAKTINDHLGVDVVKEVILK